MPQDLTVRREAEITLDPPGSLQGLIDELTALRNRNGVGANAVVETISGSHQRFKITVTKPDTDT
jgi:hypothetical protein